MRNSIDLEEFQQKYIVNEKFPHLWFKLWAINIGQLDIFDHLCHIHPTKVKSKENDHILWALINCDQYNKFDQLLEAYPTLEVGARVFRLLATKNRLSHIEKLLERKCARLDITRGLPGYGFSGDSCIYEEGVRLGYLHLLDWYISKEMSDNFSVDKCINIALESKEGILALNWLKEHGYKLNLYQIARKSIKINNVKVLNWCIENGLERVPVLIEWTLVYQSWSCLDSLIEHEFPKPVEYVRLILKCGTPTSKEYRKYIEIYEQNQELMSKVIFFTLIAANLIFFIAFYFRPFE
jgi:hypothetical protein